MSSLTKTMTMMMMMMTAIIMLMAVDVDMKPTGDHDGGAAHTESPKVAELRHKLERLHDLLKDYVKKEPNTQPTETPKGEADKGTGNDVSTPNGNDASNKTVQTTRMLRPREHVAVYHKARSVSAEDMGRSRRDPDEEDLNQLAKPKIKRQQDDSIQILAKALAKLSDHHSYQQKQKKDTDDKKMARIAPTVKPVKDKGDNNNGNSGEKLELDSSLLEKLSKLFQQQQQQPQQQQEQKDDSSQQLHHTDDGNKQQLPLWDNGAAAPDDDNSNDNDDNDNNDDDDDDDDNIDLADLMKYLADAGYSVDDFKQSGKPSRDDGGYTFDDVIQGIPPTREEVLQELESILMRDVELADSVGVSIDELIQDLEDKAFREALVRRLRRLLESNY